MNIPVPQHGKRVSSAVQQLINMIVKVIALIIGWQIDSLENVAAFATVDDTRIPDGSSKYVRSLKDTFHLDKTSTDVADGITIVATMSGTGRWVRDLQPNADWGSQGTYYVDPLTGDDENTGLTDIAALATFAEARRRLEPIGVLVPTTIYIVSDLAADDPVAMDCGGEQLTIEGIPTTVYTGEVNTYTAASGNEPEVINDAAWTSADHLHQHVSFTSGDADGMGCWILEADYGGAGNARISSIVTEGFGTQTGAAPSATDTFVVQTFPSVSFGVAFNDNRSFLYNGSLRVARLDGGIASFSDTVMPTSEFFAHTLKLGLYDSGSVGSCFVTNGFGRIQAQGGEVFVDAGAYSILRSSFGGYLQITGVTTTLDADVPSLVGGLQVESSSYLGTSLDIWMFGDFGTVAISAEAGSLYMGSNELRGRIAGTTRLMDIYSNSMFEQTAATNQILEQTVRLVDNGNQEIELDDAPLYDPSTQTYVKTGFANGTVMVHSVTVAESDLTAVAATETLDLGSALPAGARIIGFDMHDLTPFTGGTLSAFTVDVGSASDLDAIIDGADIFTAAVDGGPDSMPPGIRPFKFFATSTQLQAKFDSTGGNVADATAGSVTFDVYYTVEAP